MVAPEVLARLTAVIAATADDARARAAAGLAEIPDLLGTLAAMLMSSEWAERGLALHLVARLAPPPAAFASGVTHCLRNPLGDDPLGDEMALVLVAVGLYAGEVLGFRDALAQRVRAVERADGPRAVVMRRLAHETLAKVDAAAAAARRAFAAEVAAIADALGAGQQEEAVAICEGQCAETCYPELCRAARWEAAAARLTGAARRFALDHALRAYEWHASGASSGGEGMARMIDVERLRRMT